VPAGEALAGAIRGHRAGGPGRDHERDLAVARALAIDYACLYGAGTATEPDGIAGQPGVEPPGAATDWDDIVDAVATLQGNNFSPNAMIRDASLAADFAKLKASTAGTYLEAPSYLDGLTRLVSNQVQPGAAFIGEWRHALIGMRTDVRLRLLTERYAEELNLAFVACARMDIQLAHPGAFSYAGSAS